MNYNIRYIFLYILIIGLASFSYAHYYNDARNMFVENENYVIISYDNKVYCFDIIANKASWIHYEASNILGIKIMDNDLLVVTDDFKLPAIKLIDLKTGNISHLYKDYLETTTSKMSIAPEKYVEFNDVPYISMRNIIYAIYSNKLKKVFETNGEIRDFYVDDGLLTFKKEYGSDHLKCSLYGWEESCVFESYSYRDNHKQDNIEICGYKSYSFNNGKLYVNDTFTDENVFEVNCYKDEIYYGKRIKNNLDTLFKIGSQGKEELYSVTTSEGLWIIGTKFYNNINDELKLFLKDSILSFAEQEFDIYGNLSFKRNSPFDYTENIYSGNIDLPPTSEIKSIIKLANEYYITVIENNLESIYRLNTSTNSTYKVEINPSEAEIKEKLLDINSNIIKLDKAINDYDNDIRNLNEDISRINNEINSKENEISNLERNRSIQEGIRDSLISQGLDANAQIRTIAGIDADIRYLQRQIDSLRKNANNKELNELRSIHYNTNIERNKLSEDYSAFEFYLKSNSNEYVFCKDRIYNKLGYNLIYKYDLKSKNYSRDSALESIITGENIVCLDDNLFLIGYDKISLLDDKYNVVWDKNVNIYNSQIDYTEKFAFFRDKELKNIYFLDSGKNTKIFSLDGYSYIKKYNNYTIIYGENIQFIIDGSNIYQFNFKLNSIEDLKIKNRKIYTFTKDNEFYTLVQTTFNNQVKKYKLPLRTNAYYNISTKNYQIFLDQYILINASENYGNDIRPKFLLYDFLNDKKYYINYYPREELGKLYVNDKLFAENNSSIVKSNENNMLLFDKSYSDRKLIYYKSPYCYSEEHSNCLSFLGYTDSDKFEFDLVPGVYSLTVYSFKDNIFHQEMLKIEIVDEAPNKIFYIIALTILVAGLVVGEVLLWIKR